MQASWRPWPIATVPPLEAAARTLEQGYEFLGVMAGIALRTGAPLGLRLSPSLWARLAGACASSDAGGFSTLSSALSVDGQRTPWTLGAPWAVGLVSASLSLSQGLRQGQAPEESGSGGNSTATAALSVIRVAASSGMCTSARGPQDGEQQAATALDMLRAVDARALAAASNSISPLLSAGVRDRLRTRSSAPEEFPTGRPAPRTQLDPWSA